MRISLIPFSLLFVGLSSLVGCIGAVLVGQLVPALSAVSLVLGFIMAFYLSPSLKFEFKAPRMSIPVFLLYALIFVGIYFQSVFLFFQKGDSYWIQNPFNLGDMSFHWGTINYLAKGAHFWPENPIYLGYRFKYPFGMDFFNALFGNLGVLINYHLPLVTLAMLSLIFYALHMAGGPLLVFAVFFSSGFYNFINPGNWEPASVQQTVDFKNIFLTILLTQRGFLYALPAGVFLYKTFQKYFSGEFKPSLLAKITLGLIWGALGFFHLHSFFFLSLYFGVLILYKKDLKNWLVTIGTASLIGFPFVINALIPEAGTMSLVHWNWRGWDRDEETGYFIYWLQNLGPWILAVLASGVIFYRAKNWDRLVPTILAFVLFILFSHLILAPWAWDNIKLLIWCYVLALMTIGDLLWNDRQPAIKALVFLVMFIPGLFVFTRALPAFYPGTKWTSEKDIMAASVALRGQDVNQGIIIAAQHYEHPALLLGYKLYMGYPGHVWSHGYNYVEREALVNRLYEGDETAVASLPKGQVGLIFRGPLEKRREKTSFSVKGLSKVGEALEHEVYRIDPQ
jgi:hypothetical protein